MIRRLRRLARQTLNRIGRLLHPWRRRRAVRGLTRNGRPASLLVLCYGNICRSPYAAARLRELVDVHGDASLTVESAGFILPGRESPEIARSVARRRGIDLEGHRSRVVDRAMLERADAVLVMTRRQRRQVRRDVAGAHPPPVLLLGDRRKYAAATHDPGPIRPSGGRVLRRLRPDRSLLLRGESDARSDPDGRGLPLRTGAARHPRTLRRRNRRRMFLWGRRDVLVEQGRDPAAGARPRKLGCGHERCIQWRP